MRRARGWIRRHPWTTSALLLAAVLLIEALVGLVSVLAGEDTSTVLGVLGGISAPFVLLVVAMTLVRVGGGLARFTDANSDGDSPAPLVIRAMDQRRERNR
jgi:hypothetical protein